MFPPSSTQARADDPRPGFGGDGAAPTGAGLVPQGTARAHLEGLLDGAPDGAGGPSVAWGNGRNAVAGGVVAQQLGALDLLTGDGARAAEAFQVRAVLGGQHQGRNGALGGHGVTSSTHFFQCTRA